MNKGIRPEIMRFAHIMERVMAINDSKKRDSWKRMKVMELKNMLAMEWEEYIATHSIKELVDIANFCMMIWNREEGDA